jgi:2-phospho-L-lactate guanylyltransferase
LIPVKSFADAKHRLSTTLDAPARLSLARTMAEGVVAAAHDLPVTVVCDDRDVAAWAGAIGAAVVWCAGGLNAAVTAGVEALAHRHDHVIVAHADLPYARDLTVAFGPGITLVPDRHRDGTNVICLPSACGFRFSYGPGSFARHLAEARRVSADVRVLDDPSLAWDIDTPQDLAEMHATEA